MHRIRRPEPVGLRHHPGSDGDRQGRGRRRPVGGQRHRFRRRLQQQRLRLPTQLQRLRPAHHHDVHLRARPRPGPELDAHPGRGRPQARTALRQHHLALHPAQGRQVQRRDRLRRRRRHLDLARPNAAEPVATEHRRREPGLHPPLLRDLPQSSSSAGDGQGLGGENRPVHRRLHAQDGEPAPARADRAPQGRNRADDGARPSQRRPAQRLLGALHADRPYGRQTLRRKHGRQSRHRHTAGSRNTRRHGALHVQELHA